MEKKTDYIYKKNNQELYIKAYVFNNGLNVSFDFTDSINIAKNNITISINKVKAESSLLDYNLKAGKNMKKKLIFAIDNKNYKKNRDTINVKIDGLILTDCNFY